MPGAATGGQPGGAGGTRGRRDEGDGQEPRRPLRLGRGAPGRPAALRRRATGGGGGPGVTSLVGAVGAVDATETVRATGRPTTVVPLDGGAPPASREELERTPADPPSRHPAVALLVALGVIALLPPSRRGRLRGDGRPSPMSWACRRPWPPRRCRTTVWPSAPDLPDEHHRQGHRSCRPTRRSGTSVAKNSTVNLVISAGPNVPIVTVPSVVGQQLSSPSSCITAAGLTYTVSNRDQRRQPVGHRADADAGRATPRSGRPSRCS